MEGPEGSPVFPLIHVTGGSQGPHFLNRWFWGGHLENSPVPLQLHHQGPPWVQLHLPGV